MSILPYYGGSLIELILQAIVVMIISSFLCIFSPFGIGFAVFSVVRGKTKSKELRKISLIFQILAGVLTFIGGILAVVIVLMGGLGYHPLQWNIMFILAVLFGVGFIVTLEIVIIIWESMWLRKKT